MVKSLREGELWDIPEEFVALMGLSQITFLARKQQSKYDLSKDLEKGNNQESNETHPTPPKE